MKLRRGTLRHMRFVHSAHRETPSSGQVQAQARRSLDFLRVIESTITEAETDAQYLRTMAGEISALQLRLNEDRPSGPLDPDERAGELLLLASQAAIRMHERATTRRQHAKLDDRLSEDDGVVDCLTALIAALADYHNVIEALRHTIETHDAMLSPVIGTYTNARDLIAALRS